MKPKQVTLELMSNLQQERNKPARRFLVIEAKDTVDAVPGDVLTNDQVKTMCASNSWRVTIRKAKP